MMPLVSVVVPIYNTESFLPRCVQSVLGQSYRNIQLILIDDGSTDGSARLCDEYARADPRVIVIHQNNTGVSGARNAGIDAAGGEYIGFVDSDDWIEPKMYESLIGLAEAYHSDIAVCAVCPSGGVEKMGESETGLLDRRAAVKNVILPNGFGGYLVNKLFSADLFRDASGMRLDERIFFCEDLLLLVRVLQLVPHVAYTTAPLYHYQAGPQGVTYYYSKKRLTELEARKKIIELLEDSEAELARASYSFSACYILCLLYESKASEQSDAAFLAGEAKRYSRECLDCYPLKDRLRQSFVLLNPAVFCRLWNLMKQAHRLVRRR